MRRIVAVILVVVLVLLVASQLVLPRVAEHSAAGRLTRDGGSAHVSVSAFPAVRLLFGSGDSLKVDARGIELPAGGGGGSFDRLDEFGEVRIRLRDAGAGPLRIRSLRLDRPEGSHAYTATIQARTSPRDVAAFLGTQAGGALGGLLGDLAAGVALPGGAGTRVPLDLRATVVSRDGQREVSAASGAVAGIPAGPLVELVLDALVRRV
jgi:hypothetical protein